MDFTFGIITSNQSNYYIKKIISSIESLSIPNYEIIIIGGDNIYHEYNNVFHIDFDENIKSSWITKKKNIICSKAKYENVVLIHDYVAFSDDWYIGFLNFGNNFDICVTKIKNQNGERYRDYTLFPYGHSFTQRALIPYEYPTSLKLSKISYISGSYYIIKKKIALQYPLDERLIWGEGEDVILSKQLSNHNIILKFNKFSTVNLLKYKTPIYCDIELTNDEINSIDNMTDSQIEEINILQIKHLETFILNNKNIYINFSPIDFKIN